MSASTAQTDLNGQNLAAHLRPSQTRGHTRHGVLHFVLIVMHWNAEHFPYIVYRDFLVELLLGDNLLGAETHHITDASLQVTHACLTGVVVDDVHHNVLREGDLLIVEAVLLHLLGDEVTFGNFVFLFTQVAAQVDDFHTVAQGRMNGREVVGRGDEENLREVVVQLDEVVVEGVVLLGVKDFE